MHSVNIVYHVRHSKNDVFTEENTSLTFQEEKSDKSAFMVDGELRALLDLCRSYREGQKGHLM